jgi:hypothetical protein
MSDDFFALPPFKPVEALERLQRDLRALGLTQRGTLYERRGQAWVQAEVIESVLRVALARGAARNPVWQRRELKDSAQVRDFVTEVKRLLASQAERDE